MLKRSIISLMEAAMPIRTRRFLSLAGCLLCLLFFFSSADAGNSMDLAAFQDALGRALNANREFEGSNYAAGREEIQGTANELLPDSGPWGAWRIEPRGHWEIVGYGAKTVYSAGGVAVITNRGSGYDILFRTQPIPALLQERVTAKVADRLAEFRENPAPASVDWTLREGALLVALSHDWNGEADTARLEDQLTKFLFRAKMLIGDIVKETWQGRRDLVKEYEKRTFTSLTREEFELLVDDDDWSPWFRGTDAAKAGAYRFVVEEQPYEIRNHGDRLEFIHETPVPASLGADARARLLHETEAFAADEDAEGDPDVRVTWSDDGERLWIRLVYDLAGGVKGETIPRWYEKLWDDYGKKAGKRTAQLLEGLDEELADDRPTHLDRDAFVQLIDDGLEELEGEEDAGPGGSWSFVLADVYDLEIANHGDAMELLIAEQLPAAGDADAILAAVREAVGDGRPKHADRVEIDWYPGSEKSWIAVRAICSYDGGRKGEQIHDCYHDFVYDWCRDVHERVQKAFARFEE